uniref:Uncharacterized protein n=1 Tax=Panagrolaimus sp. ES5 TaxID=591445 RepID=A0AC34FSX2_9BILA
MISYQSMTGIAYHRKIMDHYYIYTDLKTKNDGMDEEDKRAMCEQYLAVITECLNCIDKLPFGDTRRNFLDWLRWNKLLIMTELLQFKEEFGGAYGLAIDGLTTRLFKLLDTAFVLTEAEKGESNEYAQAFAIIQRKEESFQSVSVLLVQQASRLLINYINLLTRKCYTKTFDRVDYSFQTLQGEVDYLVTALKRSNDYHLASTVEDTYKAYCEFCEIDEKSLAELDEQIKIALEAAHKRATETFLEHVIREIQERIKEIKAAASVKAGDIWSGMKLASRGRPSDHLANFLQMFKHPIKTVKKIKEFAVENPWKFTGIVLGGVAIGVGAGIIGAAGGLAVGLAIFHCPLLAIAGGATVGLIATPCLAIAGGAALGLLAGGLSVVNNVNKQIEKIQKDTEKKVAIEEAKIAAIKLKITQQRNRIIEDAEFNKIRRTTLEQTEEEIKKCKEFMNNVQSEQREKFERMSKKELNKSELEMSDGINQLAIELTRTKEESRECNQKLVVIQNSVTRTYERRALVIRRIQNAKTECC